MALHVPKKGSHLGKEAEADEKDMGLTTHVVWLLLIFVSWMGHDEDLSCEI